MSETRPARSARRERGEALQAAISLMRGFAERTGLVSDRSEKRYLWTDAFAVCNLLELARQTGEERYNTLALRLVDRVHHVLGRFRADDQRTGWISGLGETEGEAHPTRGGLRIGKRLPERSPEEPFDERLEWDRDGQYFHYLTKWMLALDQVSGATGDPRFNLWARELAEVAHASFCYGSRGARRMVWKMSTDLSRPLVPSMGQHDPLDGFVTYVQLEATASRLSSRGMGPGLEEAVAGFAAMIQAIDVRTSDPLGIGGLLSDACRVAQLVEHEAFDGEGLLERSLAGARAGLSQYVRYGELRQPASRRLAFRELGLAIGLSAIDLIREFDQQQGFVRCPAIGAALDDLGRYRELGPSIVGYWLDREHRRSGTWHEHLDINEVMLATSLIPHGYLVILSDR